MALALFPPETYYPAHLNIIRLPRSASPPPTLPGLSRVKHLQYLAKPRKKGPPPALPYRRSICRLLPATLLAGPPGSSGDGRVWQQSDLDPRGRLAAGGRGGNAGVYGAGS
jgi:hypothetical protein